MVFTPSFKQNVFEFSFASAPKKVYTLPTKEYLNADLASRLTNAAMAANAGKEIYDKAKAIADATGEEIVLPESFDQSALSNVVVLQREVFDKYAPGAFMVGTQDEITQIWTAWSQSRDESSVSLGESSALSNS
ncbi:hypothetical protein SAMN04489740_2682 [Arthrobacter alpinus]|uniref:Uncharacterized protein n=1 Tax=Arthrobacter alpinus TaxID=656366 RepID=A0A1H5M1B7_9MICC|nr:hypothetical protein [Arthrobacter alpinus]SEE82401.1 hypothetical protein SAMN04489740_2682 [Arthrobacter alpinus]